eukprot:226319-Pleurochrysis_carterae.AAC.1
MGERLLAPCAIATVLGVLIIAPLELVLVALEVDGAIILVREDVLPKAVGPARVVLCVRRVNAVRVVLLSTAQLSFVLSGHAEVRRRARM